MELISTELQLRALFGLRADNGRQIRKWSNVETVSTAPIGVTSSMSRYSPTKSVTDSAFAKASRTKKTIRCEHWRAWTMTSRTSRRAVNLAALCLNHDNVASAVTAERGAY